MRRWKTEVWVWCEKRLVGKHSDVDTLRAIPGLELVILDLLMYIF